jgi:hypothetical protein
MEALILLNEKRILAQENVDYIQILRMHHRDDEKHLKRFEDGNLVLWLPKDPKINEGEFFFPWTSPFRIKKAFNNNIVQLSTLSNEDIAVVNVNKFKVYRNLIIMVIVITIITQDKNRILPNIIPRRRIGRKMQFYQWFKFNE